MIVFINGPFGIGKTTTASLLAERIDNAFIFDPEIIGTLLQKMFGKIYPVSDFQEYRLWPFLTVLVLRFLLVIMRRPLVVPMTITDRGRWLYVSQRLKTSDSKLTCICLTCSEQELRRRILSRPDAEGSHEWCLAHVAQGLEIMQDATFGLPIATEGKTPEQVADEIIQVVFA